MADVPARARLESGAVAVVACAAGTYVGFWFAPFVIGIAAGILSARRVRWTVITAMAGAWLARAVTGQRAIDSDVRHLPLWTSPACPDDSRESG
jgi:hypothetical protein